MPGAEVNPDFCEEIMLRILSIALLAGLLTGCGTLPATLGIARGSIPGFDTRTYPGDAAMKEWLEKSPYRWVGYYLVAPCYTGNSWVGKRERLTEMGWGMAVLFVGEQDWGAISGVDPTPIAREGARCTRLNVNATTGEADAQSAAVTTASEGFPGGTIVYLDVERVDSVSSNLAAYVRAWFRGMLNDGRYTPGLYAHRHNADVLHAIAQAEFAARGRTDPPRLWVARSGGFSLDSSPSDSGVMAASIWQGQLDVVLQWGDVRLLIDENVALRGIPGMTDR